MVSTEVKLLYDFKYIIPGKDDEIIHLKSGEFFNLHEEKGERWLAVKKSGKDDVYYVPVHYVEQFRIVNDPDIAKRLTPPKPPYKPKNLLQRMQSDQDDEPLSPPPIEEDSFVELYNFLLKTPTESTSTPTESKQNMLSSGENLSCENQPQLFETKSSSNKLLTNQDKEIMESSYRKSKEHNKKKIPVPRSGDVPLKVFPSGYEMYRDDISGQVYYYNTSTCESSWILPRVEPKPRHSSSNTADPSSLAHSRTKSTSGDLFPHKQSHWTKCGFLKTLKLTDNGGKLNKYWSLAFAVLEGTCLYFFKDQKSSSNRAKSDLVVDLQNSFVLKGGSNNKQNLIHVIMSSGSEYLLHSDSTEVAQQWFDVLSVVAKKEGSPRQDLTGEGLVKFKSINEEQSSSLELNKSELLKTRQKSGSLVVLDQPAEKTTLKEKLKSWLLRRPTQDSLRERGIYKDQIFGSFLSAICKQHSKNIPTFVSTCIEIVERDGLSVDGIYRVNGNAAEIQKLRFAVNQNAPYDLSNMDIHTVTGALKLFFRELREPLFPFDHYKPLLNAFSGQNKLEEIKDILDKFPKENYDTLRELLRHLLKVEEHSTENRMKTTNLAIVFGPTLLWPKESHDFESLAQSLMLRGQLVEFLLQNFAALFVPDY